MTVDGETDGHKNAGSISRATLRAIVESAKGIRPDDLGEDAVRARRIAGYGDLDGLRFWAKIGVAPARGDFPARNILTAVITPEQADWKPIAQIARTAPQTTAAAAPAAQAALGRPSWAH